MQWPDPPRETILLLRRMLGCATGGACGRKRSARSCRKTRAFHSGSLRRVPHHLIQGHVSAHPHLDMAFRFRRMRLLLTPAARPALYRELRRPLTSRPFAAAAVLHGPKPLPPRPTINENDITETFLRGSGPGGQKIVPNDPICLSRCSLTVLYRTKLHQLFS